MESNNNTNNLPKKLTGMKRPRIGDGPNSNLTQVPDKSIRNFPGVIRMGTLEPSNPRVLSNLLNTEGDKKPTGVIDLSGDSEGIDSKQVIPKTEQPSSVFCRGSLYGGVDQLKKEITLLKNENSKLKTELQYQKVIGSFEQEKANENEKLVKFFKDSFICCVCHEYVNGVAINCCASCSGGIICTACVLQTNEHSDIEVCPVCKKNFSDRNFFRPNKHLTNFYCATFNKPMGKVQEFEAVIISACNAMIAIDNCATIEETFKLSMLKMIQRFFRLYELNVFYGVYYNFNVSEYNGGYELPALLYIESLGTTKDPGLTMKTVHVAVNEFCAKFSAIVSYFNETTGLTIDPLAYNVIMGLPGLIALYGFTPEVNGRINM